MNSEPSCIQNLQFRTYDSESSNSEATISNHLSRTLLSSLHSRSHATRGLHSEPTTLEAPSSNLHSRSLPTRTSLIEAFFPNPSHSSLTNPRLAPMHQPLRAQHQQSHSILAPTRPSPQRCINRAFTSSPIFPSLYFEPPSRALLASNPRCLAARMLTSSKRHFAPMEGAKSTAARTGGSRLPCRAWGRCEIALPRLGKVRNQPTAPWKPREQLHGCENLLQRCENQLQLGLPTFSPRSYICGD